MLARHVRVIVGRIRGGLMQVGLFASGVTIGLGYVYISRPHPAELPLSGEAARAPESAREVIVSQINDAPLSVGVEGPASIAFADPAMPAY